MAGTSGMTWLAECSATALAEALQVVVPGLGGYPVTVPGPAGKQDPQWHSGSVPVGEQFFVKFAWSHPAAIQLAHEIGVLAALTRDPAVPFLPDVIATSADPVLLITRRVPGASLFDIAGSIDPDRAASQLVRFMAALHSPDTRQRTETAVGPLPGPVLPPATTADLRGRLAPWIRPDQRHTIIRWCDWADAVLASSGPAVLVHGDLHGDNQVWDHGELLLVMDFATAAAAEPEYELRAFPGPGLGPGLELLTAVMRHYQQATGRKLSADRIMAWHLRQALYDTLWHSEAGLPLNDHRTPPEWVDDLAVRFSALGINPEVPPEAIQQTTRHPDQDIFENP